MVLPSPPPPHSVPILKRQRISQGAVKVAAVKGTESAATSQLLLASTLKVALKLAYRKCQGGREVNDRIQSNWSEADVMNIHLDSPAKAAVAATAAI